MTRDGTWDPCIESMESQPLDHQGSPLVWCLNQPCAGLVLWEDRPYNLGLYQHQFPFTGHSDWFVGKYESQLRTMGLETVWLGEHLRTF